MKINKNGIFTFFFISSRKKNSQRVQKKCSSHFRFYCTTDGVAVLVDWWRCFFFSTFWWFEGRTGWRRWKGEKGEREELKVERRLLHFLLLAPKKVQCFGNLALWNIKTIIQLNRQSDENWQFRCFIHFSHFAAIFLFPPPKNFLFTFKLLLAHFSIFKNRPTWSAMCYQPTELL